MMHSPSRETNAKPSLDRVALRAHFNNAAAGYDAHAVLQREVAGRLLERLDLIQLQPKTILDLGCGTGYCTRDLARRYPKAKVLGLDIAPAMVRQATRLAGWRQRWFGRQTYSCGDAEQLPLPSSSVDLVFSSLTLQWCDPRQTFAEVARVLRPNGLFLFSTMGPDTLKELRQAWQAVDHAPHVHPFLDMHDLGDMLLGGGFVDPVMDMEQLVMTYPTVEDALRDIRGIGAGNANAARHRGLTGKHRYRAFREAYSALQNQGRIPATFELVFGLGWGPRTELGHDADPGLATVPLSTIRRRR